MNDRSMSPLKFTRRVALAASVLGTAACLFGYWQWPRRFFEAYLFTFVLVTGVGLGCLALLMLHHLVGGKWGRATRRILEAGAWPLVLAPFLGVPLLLGIGELYLWADANVVRQDELLAKKAAYLDVEFFQWRTAGYLLTWAVLTIVICWRPATTNGTRQSSPGRWHRMWSAVGLPIYVLTVTFASIDWMMSLEPHWFSSMYGVIVIAGQAAAAYGVAVVTLAWLREDPYFAALAKPEIYQDLGNLLLAAITFWAYVSFSQFLIIWSGNLVEEVPWYLARSRDGWQGMAAALVLFHFVVPFIALLSSGVKRRPRMMGGIGAMVAVMHVVDVYWLIMPALRPALELHLLDVVTLLTLGAIWKTAAIWRLERTGQPAFEHHPASVHHEPFRAVEQPGP